MQEFLKTAPGTSVQIFTDGTIKFTNPDRTSSYSTLNLFLFQSEDD